MDRAQRELAEFTADWTAAGFALYEQGGDGVWRKMREYPFAVEVPTVPHQQTAAEAREATRLWRSARRRAGPGRGGPRPPAGGPGGAAAGGRAGAAGAGFPP